MSHTPGPFTCSRADMHSYRAHDGKQVSYVYLPDRSDGSPVERVQVATDNPVDDARLFAASPDMLAALKMAEQLLRDVAVADSGDLEQDAFEREAHAAVVAAIAKAEGL